MLLRQIKKYEQTIVAEEKLAEHAPSAEIALAHHQAAMLYRTELSILRRKQAATVGQTLAEIW